MNTDYRISRTGHTTPRKLSCPLIEPAEQSTLSPSVLRTNLNTPFKVTFGDCFSYSIASKDLQQHLTDRNKGTELDNAFKKELKKIEPPDYDIKCHSIIRSISQQDRKYKKAEFLDNWMMEFKDKETMPTKFHLEGLNLDSEAATSNKFKRSSTLSSHAVHNFVNNTNSNSKARRLNNGLTPIAVIKGESELYNKTGKNSLGFEKKMCSYYIAYSEFMKKAKQNQRAVYDEAKTMYERLFHCKIKLEAHKEHKEKLSTNVKKLSYKARKPKSKVIKEEVKNFFEGVISKGDILDERMIRLKSDICEINQQILDVKSKQNKLLIVIDTTKHSLQIITNILYELYHSFLENAYEPKQEGLIWVIKAIWKLGNEVDTSRISKKLDDSCAAYLIHYSELENQLADILQDKIKVLTIGRGTSPEESSCNVTPRSYAVIELQDKWKST